LPAVKKTDPIAKDSLEKITPVKNFAVKAHANGVYISNNEDTNLIVKKSDICKWQVL
jgi:hypothetical protein